MLVSDRFTGERFLNRHRMIYGTLTAELSTAVHALAAACYTLKRVGRVAGYYLRVTYNMARETVAASKTDLQLPPAFSMLLQGM